MLFLYPAVVKQKDTQPLGTVLAGQSSNVSPINGNPKLLESPHAGHPLTTIT